MIFLILPVTSSARRILPIYKMIPLKYLTSFLKNLIKNNSIGFLAHQIKYHFSRYYKNGLFTLNSDYNLCHTL